MSTAVQRLNWCLAFVVLDVASAVLAFPLYAVQKAVLTSSSPTLGTAAAGRVRAVAGEVCAPT
jgi:hypothetical protein